MFRGGDYVDRPGFYDKATGKPVNSSLNTNDIEGAQPKRRFGSRDSQGLGQAGQQIMDAGAAHRIYTQQKLQAQGQAVGNLFSMGTQKMENKRDPLSTHDINGGIKRNQYGAVLHSDHNLEGKAAGGQVAKFDKYGSNYERHIPDTSTKNRS